MNLHDLIWKCLTKVMKVYTNLKMYSEFNCITNDKCVEKSSSLNYLGRGDVSKLCNQNRLKIIMIGQKFKVVDIDKDLKRGHNFWKEVVLGELECCKRCRYLQD